MSGAYRCPYCLQHVRATAEATVVPGDGPLATCLGLDEDAAVQADCYRNVADRA
jgi:hypothetical protein